ncbi:hypothetical protein CPC08DRAFT_738172 [Agrocybe pediades]|nr:hypothetical protein CPC08DRAFT_738172 [Agrocybe pediades]
MEGDDGSQVSLGINYIPKKFSSSILARASGAWSEDYGSQVGLNSARSKGKRKESGDRLIMPKWGGGVDAFGADLDSARRDEKGRVKKKRWNGFKWTLFVTNMLLTLYSLAALIVCLLFWFDVWTHASVIRVGNKPELIMSTVAASVGLFTAIIGWAGILLNNRQFLAVYTLLTWLAFAALVIPGYVSFRRRSLNLEGKLNAQWSQDLGVVDRMKVQDALHCCGWYSPFVEASISSTCYSRSILPGCKTAYLNFQRLVLGRWALVVFSVVPAQIAVITAALLCSNQVTYRFGKGMMPEQYRLNQKTMSVIMDNYKSQLELEREAMLSSEFRRRSWVQFQSGSDAPSLKVPTPRTTSRDGTAREPHYRTRSSLVQVPYGN